MDLVIKGTVGLYLRWKYDFKLFLAKKLASEWLTGKISQSEASFFDGK